jgi:hypothetical protein
MNLVDRLKVLLPFLGPPAEETEEERLLKLYWNRAGLKKELASLDDQLYQLRDRLKQQQAATERAAEETESLETLLGNPEQGPGALVHYQLRALWRACYIQLEQFGADLRRQQEDRERKRELLEFHTERQGRVEAAAQRRTEAELKLEQERAAFAAVETRLQAASGLWHYFKRRELTEERADKIGRCARAQHQLEELQQAMAAIEKEAWPEFGGLSLEGKRAINLAVLAYAQLLYQRLTDMGLALQTRLAHLKSVYESTYGSPPECVTVMADIASALAAVKRQKDLAPHIRARTELLRAKVTYRHPEDSVPEPGSLPSIGDNPAVSARDSNVLSDDYWNVYKVLLQ